MSPRGEPRSATSFQKLARQAFGTNNVDHGGGPCHSPTVPELTEALGSGGMTESMDDIVEPAPSVVIIGSKNTEQRRVLETRLRPAAKDRGLSIIVADLRRVPIVDAAALHRPPRRTGLRPDAEWVGRPALHRHAPGRLLGTPHAHPTTVPWCPQPARRCVMYGRILVAVDGSKASEAALKRALDLTKAWSAEVRLLHVIDSPYSYPEALYAELSTEVEALGRAWHRAGQAVLDRAAALARDGGAKAEAALLETNGRRIGAVIVDEAKRWHADLIVVATYGRHEEVLLGSVAEDVARKASASVLLVRGQ